MDEIMNYVKPELLLVSAVLYFLGIAVQRAQLIKDKYIPIFLGAAGILFCTIWVLSQCTCDSPRQVAMAVFTALTQGILVAGLSTYVNQLVKQSRKDE